MGVKGDNSSLRGPGAEPMAEGEAAPHKRSEAERARRTKPKKELRRTQKRRTIKKGRTNKKIEDF